MSIVLSPGLVVSPPPGFQPHWPIIAWANLVTIENVEADTAAADYPVTNLANPSTNLRWQGSDATDQSLTVTLAATRAIDGVALASHNFGSTGAIVSLEGLTAEPGAVYEEIFPEFAPADDGPILMRFTEANLVGVKINLQPGTAAPRLAVLHVSKLLTIPRGVAPGHTPIVDGHDVELLTGRSQSGDYLGSIVTGESLSTTAAFNDIDGTIYRDTMRGFVKAANEGRAFFFGWSPTWHPAEIGYCTVRESIRPVVNQRTGEVDVRLALGGTAV